MSKRTAIQKQTNIYNAKSSLRENLWKNHDVIFVDLKVYIDIVLKIINSRENLWKYP